MFAGIGDNVPCTTVNKVCASGMKSIALGAQSIMLGDNDLVVVGGMENMSMVPHYYNARSATKLGNVKMGRWYGARRINRCLQLIPHG